MTRPPIPRLVVVWACALLAAAPAAGAEVLRGLARVNEDASLSLAGERVVLAHIHIPETGRSCDPRFRPVPCAERAVLALRRRVAGFVECRTLGPAAEGGLVGVCVVGSGYFSEGEDIGLWLVRQGLALALPEAPFAYRAAEKIARTQRRGVWGFAERP